MDITTLNGYREGMSADEILELVKNFEIPKGVSKETFDKTASELAKYKKEYKEKLSEAEKTALEKEEYYKKIVEENEAFKTAKEKAELRAGYIGVGYTDDMATRLVEAEFSGDRETAFSIRNEYREKITNDIKAELIKSTPTPEAGKTGNSFTVDDIKHMSPSEINKNWNEISEILKNN